MTKFISVAGAGRPAGDIIREQLKNHPSEILNQALPILSKLEKGKEVKDVPTMFNALFRPSVQPYLISWFKYNPQIEITKLNIPILVMQGTTDIQVKITDAEELASHNPQVKKVIIEGMNHILKETEMDRTKNISTYTMPDLPLHNKVISTLVGFINN